MIIGFTGTRLGMTSKQRDSIEAILNFMKQLKEHEPEEVHHGDCVGADEQFHRMCQLRRLCIVIHPPDNESLRANCIGGVVLVPKPYLDRNEDIVNVSDILFAAPKGSEQFQGSGTWQTIRRAKRWNRNVIIIHPEGGCEWRRGGSFESKKE